MYYGLIKQSTGEDWTNAKLSLSTANPSIGGSVPELGVQLLKFKHVYIPRKSKRWFTTFESELATPKFALQTQPLNTRETWDYRQVP